RTGHRSAGSSSLDCPILAGRSGGPGVVMCIQPRCGGRLRALGPALHPTGRETMAARPLPRRRAPPAVEDRARRRRVMSTSAQSTTRLPLAAVPDTPAPRRSALRLGTIAQVEHEDMAAGLELFRAAEELGI